MQEDLEQRHPRRRALEGVRGVGVVEAAAVGAQLLDDLLRGDRAAGQELRRAGQRARVGAGGQVLHHAAEHQHDARRRREIGSRIRVIARVRSTQKLPSRSVLVRAKPRTTAIATAMPIAGGDEVLHRQAGHLDEVAHRRLAAVALPVRVGHEADRGVPRRARLDGGHPVVQRQPGLHPLQEVEQRARRRRRRPARCAGRSASAARCRRPRPTARYTSRSTRQCFVGGEHPGHVVAQRPVHRGQRRARAGANCSQPAAAALIRTAPGRAGTPAGRATSAGGDHQPRRRRPRSQPLHPAHRQRQQPEDHQRQHHEDHVGHAAHPRSDPADDPSSSTPRGDARSAGGRRPAP